MFPVSGAAQFIASGAMSGLRPEISANGAYSRLLRPGPHSGWRMNRFHSPRARASRCRSATTGGSRCGSPSRRCRT